MHARDLELDPPGRRMDKLTLEDFNAIPSPRVIKTHAPRDLFLATLPCSPPSLSASSRPEPLVPGIKVVYCSRQAKDAVVSAYYHAKVSSGQSHRTIPRCVASAPGTPRPHYPTTPPLSTPTSPLRLVPEPAQVGLSVRRVGGYVDERAVRTWAVERPRRRVEGRVAAKPVAGDLAQVRRTRPGGCCRFGAQPLLLAIVLSENTDPSQEPGAARSLSFTSTHVATPRTLTERSGDWPTSCRSGAATR